MFKIPGMGHTCGRCLLHRRRILGLSLSRAQALRFQAREPGIDPVIPIDVPAGQHPERANGLYGTMDFWSPRQLQNFLWKCLREEAERVIPPAGFTRELCPARLFGELPFDAYESALAGSREPGYEARSQEAWQQKEHLGRCQRSCSHRLG